MMSIETQASPPAVNRAISRAREVLAAWTVEQYLTWRARKPKHPLPKTVFVAPNDTLGDILRLLARHNILSAPILERSTGKFSGFVDVGEILGLFVSRARRWLEREYGTSHGSETPGLPQNTAKETIGLYPGQLRNENYAAKDEASLLDQMQQGMGVGMFMKTLRAARADFPDAQEGDGEAVFRGFLQASLLAMVSAAFLHPISEPRLRPFAVTGTLASNHRVGVYDWDPAFDDGSRIADPSQFEICSQSDIVRFLFEKKTDPNLVEFLGLGLLCVGLLKRGLEQGEQGSVDQDNQAHITSTPSSAQAAPTPALRPGLSIPNSTMRVRGVLCVEAGKTTSLEAFALMHADRVSALGVCDANGLLIGNLSASDLRGITPDTLNVLEQDVGVFIQRGGAKNVVTCPLTATVGAAIELLVTKKVHHVYVCDDKNRPVAMVTPNDVLRVLADVLVEG